MAKLRFVGADERRFVSVGDRAEREPALRAALARGVAPGSERGSRCLHHPGTDDEPQLIESRYAPDQRIAAHAHAVDEIFVVVAGEAHFGRRVCPVGSSVFIPRLTLYSFRAGPEGLTVLNFRPRADAGAITKEDLVASRG